MKTFLGIDVGTTSLKAAVFDENGRRLGFRSVDYTLDTDPASGVIEFDAEKYIDVCRRVIAELSAECGRPDALSIDTQGETLILADGDGRPLCPAVVWLDNRAASEADEIRAAFGCRRVYEVTGQPEITAGWPASKLLWFRRRRPEIWARVGKIFLLEDWLLYRLTGEFVTEPTIQSSTIYYDITRRAWWREMLDFLGVREEQLPRLCRSMEPVGVWEGIPVVAGALDQIAGTIGCGITDDTRISEMTGTIMAICAMTDTIPPYDPGSIIPCHVHAVEGKYCRILWSPTAGMALKWFRDTFSEGLSFDDLNVLAAAVPPGCDGLTVLPYFTGSTMPRYDPDAKAVFTGVTLAHGRGHFARAIMESVAYLLRKDLEYIGADAIREIRVTGGGANSPLWVQMKADVTGKTMQTVRESETACLGTAIFAAVGVGAFPSAAEAAARLVSPKETVTPSGADYEEAFRRFCETDRRFG
jgi:xylulokinase